MNILITAPQPFFQERGTPIAVKLLAQTLAESGYNIHLLVYHEGEPIQITGVTLHRNYSLLSIIKNIKPGLSWKKIVCDFFFFIKLLTMAKKYRFDIIHAVEESAFMAIALNKIYGIPYIYDMDSCMSQQIVDKFPAFKSLSACMEFFERSAVKNSLSVLAVCQSLKEKAREYGGATKHIEVIEDISLLDKTVQGHEYLRKEYNITGAILMYIGNLEKYQGIDLLLESFQLIINESDANLVLIGGAPEDIEHYRNKARQLNIHQKTYFCGPRPVELLAFYLNQADILVSPRTQGNNTPMKIYSYLDSGRPVVATRLATHTQVLTDNISCLVDPTPKSMAEGCLKLLKNAQSRDLLVLSAKKIVSEHYSADAFRRKMIHFYKTLPLMPDKKP